MSQPRMLGRYELFEELGHGAFAIVYRGHDTTLNRPVAVKIMHAIYLRQEELIDRFKLEAETAANLDHPHIIPIFDFGEFEGRLFIVMKLMSGGTVADLLAHGTLPWAQALTYFQQLADALDYAHGRGIIHRDLKPSNIFIDQRQNSILGDFGIGKTLADDTRGLTRTGTLLGTPAYMPPEIWNGQPPTPATDQYALACLFYEMLTGQKLFHGETDPAIMKAHFQPPNFPAQWPPDVPPGVAAVLRQAVAAEPSQRFPTLTLMAQQLASLRLDPFAEPYATLQAAFAAQQWATVLDEGEKILAQAPTYQDVSALVQQAEAELIAQQAAPWRTEAETAIAQQQWGIAEASLHQWLRLDPTNTEAQTLLTQATAARQTAPPPRQIPPTPPPSSPPQEALPPPATTTPTTTAKSHAMWVWGGLGMLLLLLLAGWWYTDQQTQQAQAMATSQAQAMATSEAQATANSQAQAEATRLAQIPPVGNVSVGSRWVRPQDGMTMVYVPQGSFRMGSNDGDSDERPVRQVTLDAFWLDQTEVTNQQYNLCVAAGACEPSSMLMILILMGQINQWWG
jgi:serine/threonine protein kinase